MATSIWLTLEGGWICKKITGCIKNSKKITGIKICKKVTAIKTEKITGIKICKKITDLKTTYWNSILEKTQFVLYGQYHKN